MKLILQKDVKNLGKTGEQVSVKKGFARNFLIPKGYAVLMNKNSFKAWEHQKIIIEAKKRKALSERKALIYRLSSIKLKFEKEAQKDNRLFGSVTAHEISQALEKLHNISVDKKDIHFSELKTAGEHKIKIRLDSENQTEIPLSIKVKGRKIIQEKQASGLNTKKANESSADVKEEKPNIDALEDSTTIKTVSAEDLHKTTTVKAVSEDLQQDFKEETAEIHTAQAQTKITSQNKKKADTKQLQGEKEHKTPALDKQETSSPQGKKAESSHNQEKKQKESLKKMTSDGAKKAQKETFQKNQAAPEKPSLNPMDSFKIEEEKASAASSKKETLDNKKASSKQAKPLEKQKALQEKAQSSAKPKQKKAGFLKKLFQNK